MKKFKNEVSVSEEMGSVINELIFRNLETDYNDYKVGDRVAQIMIIPHPEVEFEEADELSDTERGEGGFGSTGK